MVAVCSVCGESPISKTQMRKAASIRRCNKCITRNHYHAGDDDDDDVNDHDPDGIDVNITCKGMQCRQTQTEFGRSVHLDRDTSYCIDIKTDPGIFGTGKTRIRVAVDILVDGQKVSPAPIQIGRSRSIEGYTLSRITKEIVEGDNRGNSYLIQNKMKEFRTSSSRETSRRGNTINNKLGTIECRFYKVKLVPLTRNPGTRRRNHCIQSQVSDSSYQARNGLMETGHGKQFERRGAHHSNGHKKPIADKSKPLGSCRLFICEQRVRTLGDYLSPNL